MMKNNRRISFTFFYVLLMTFMLISLIAFKFHDENSWNKHINNIFTTSNKLSARLKAPLSPSDPKLISYIKQNFLFPPSTKAYNLLKNDNSTAFYSFQFIRSVLQQLFRDKNGGFFVEAGALDGEMLSNTLELETKNQWTGLLVEPNKEMLPKLRGKNRKAWITPTCLGVKPYPYSTILAKYEHKDGNNNPKGWPGSSTITDTVMDLFASGFTNYEVVQCLPIESLLRALEVTKIDFFSLDIQEMEKDVLKSFPFHLVDVDVWIVEHIIKFKFVQSDDNKFYSEKIDGSYFRPDVMKKYNASLLVDIDLIEFMESKGYYFFDMICSGVSDLVFVKTNSDIFKRLKVPLDQMKRRNLCDDKIIISSYQSMMSDIKIGDLRGKNHWPQLEYKNKKR